jgi:HlyD family secretion protein
MIALALLAILGGGAYVTLGLGHMSVIGPPARPTPASQATSRTTDAAEAAPGDRVVAKGIVVPVRSAQLRFAGEGTVAEVLVKPGDRVTQGAPLAGLDARALKLAVERARATRNQAQAAYDQLAAGATEGEVAAARAQVAQAEAQLRQARGGVTAQDITAAQATLEEARANRAKLLAGPSAADVQAAQAALDQANSTLQSQRDNLSAAKTNAQLQLEQRANDLIIAQSIFAAARQRWHDVQGDSGKPSPVYDAYLQAEAGLHNAEAAVKQAQIDYDTARQAEVTGIATTEAQVRSAQAALDKLRAGPTNDQIAAAKAQLANAESALVKLRGEQRAGSIDSASAGVMNAQADLDELVATPRPIDLASALAQVRQGDVAVKQAELALEQATLTAPFAGTVVSVNIAAGEPPGTSTPAIVLAEISSWRITTTDLAERNAVRVQVGDAATITFDALPGVSLPGAVADITLIGENKQGEMTYTATIAPKQQDARLRWNMTASVAIDAK